MHRAMLDILGIRKSFSFDNLKKSDEKFWIQIETYFINQTIKYFTSLEKAEN
jgi:hypothetical protein